MADRFVPERNIELPRHPSRARKILPVLWGVVLLGGGIVVWSSSRGRVDPVPGVWKETSGPAGPVSELRNDVRTSGPDQGDLLRLEWPTHPRAESYLLRFQGEGRPPIPVPVQGNVFLYDLQSDVLRLPRDLEWEVSAILADGSEVVTPSRRIELPD